MARQKCTATTNQEKQDTIKKSGWNWRKYILMAAGVITGVALFAGLIAILVYTGVSTDILTWIGSVIQGI